MPNPELASQPVLGSAPTPATTTSAGYCSSVSVAIPVSLPAMVLMRATRTPVLTVIPWLSSIRWNQSDSAGSENRPKTSGPTSSTVTSAPTPRAVAATSIPMKLPPTTTTLTPGFRTALRAVLSPTVRSRNTPGVSAPGTASRRECEPVARSIRSYSSRSPLASVTDRFFMWTDLASTPSR